VVPGTSDRIADQQAVTQRRPIVSARRADGRQRAALMHEQGRFATDMACHGAAFTDIRQRNALSEIGSSR
jgi:hypothetical protein